MAMGIHYNGHCKAPVVYTNPGSERPFAVIELHDSLYLSGRDEELKEMIGALEDARRRLAVFAGGRVHEFGADTRGYCRECGGLGKDQIHVIATEAVDGE